MSETNELPGCASEHLLQEQFGTTKRAKSFYRNQVLDHLNARMQQFIAEREMVMIATADAAGECDCSFRAGPIGFVRVFDQQTLAYPEYRGNGVMASLGNITENPHIGMWFVDFFKDAIGLHVNGGAKIVENDQVLSLANVPSAVQDDIGATGGRTPERWVVVNVEEAYIHCSKHVPLLARREKEISWGTDDVVKKGGDYFGAARQP